jgi:protease I
MPVGLQGKRFAVVAADGFEQSELVEPQTAIKRSGSQPNIISVKRGRIQGMRHHEKGDTMAVDVTIDESEARIFAGLVLPGWPTPDALRLNPKVVAFVRRFFDTENR